MNSKFREDNTEGYTDAQLAELNRRYEAEVATLSPEDASDKSLTDNIGERILADFDSDVVKLGRITNRDEAGRHFTEVYSGDWLTRMESLGLITIDRPVHEATGIPYACEYWSVAVSPAVADWF